MLSVLLPVFFSYASHFLSELRVNNKHEYVPLQCDTTSDGNIT